MQQLDERADAAQAARHDPPGWRIHVVLGRFLLVCWVVTAAGMLLGGSVESSAEELRATLEADAAAGNQTTLEVVRPFTGDQGRPGSAEDSLQEPMEGSYCGRVEVHWRDGLLRRQTDDVLIASSQKEARECGADPEGDDTWVVVAPDLVWDEWAAIQPDLVVEPLRNQSSRGTTSFWGHEWWVPSWAMLGLFFVGLATFTRMLVGPQPWRATRWAWAWLMLLVWPIGVPGYLLLGGGAGLFPPKRPERRVTAPALFFWVLVAPFVLAVGLMALAMLF